MKTHNVNNLITNFKPKLWFEYVLMVIFVLVFWIVFEIASDTVVKFICEYGHNNYFLELPILLLGLFSMVFISFCFTSGLERVIFNILKPKN